MRVSKSLLKSISYDLRSDTVTRPCAQMKEAMMIAEVGDDVFEDDPTVKKLEARVAQITGKQAGLFVPSGTMANLIAVGIHCSRGDEVITGDNSHIFVYEAGGASAHMGVAFHTVKNAPDGTIPIAKIKDAIRPLNNVHFSRTKLVAIENTQNKCGERAISAKYMAKVADLCRSNHLKLHVDGARLFNAAIALRTDPKELLLGVDTASICLSKGLGCPVGTVLVGDKEFINRARYMRKSLGGGMRQAGILAAAGLFALDNNISKLVEDHRKAQALAQILCKSPNIILDPAAIETNIVYFDITNTKLTAQEICHHLKINQSVLINSVSDSRIRAITHLDIAESDVEEIANKICLEVERKN